jgi:peroxiredoxin Q/BCP
MAGNYKVGDKMPAFKSTIENGETISNETIKGKDVIFFFYPKDDTPTCTKEACNLRDNYKIFKKNKIEVYGVSPDSESKHVKYIAKYDLPFSLISDPDKELLNLLGYYGPKKFMGKEVVGVYRTTIVINKEGVITHIIEKVVSAKHSAQLVEVLGIK